MLKLLILLLLVPTQGHAQALEGSPFRDFSEGLNDVADPSNLKKEQSPALLNVVIDDPPGSIVPRQGITRCGITPSGNTATGLYEFVKADGSRRMIVSDNTNVWQTPDCVAFSTITTAGSSTSRFDFKTIRNKLWMVNRTTHPITWDGSTATLLDGRANTPSPVVPRCAYLEYWLDKAWCARTTGEPSSIAFSALTGTDGTDLDPSTGTLSWPAANTIYVDRDGGCPIYGIKAYRNNLYVFKGECGIWRIAYENDFNIAVIRTLAQVGTKFHTSIIEKDNVLEFVGPDGIYAFDGDQTVRLSDNINNTFERLRQPTVNESFKIWTADADFNEGTYSSTTANGDTLQLSSYTALMTNGDFETGSLSPFSCVVNAVASKNSVCGITQPGQQIGGVYSASVTINVGTHANDYGVRLINSVSGSTLAFLSQISQSDTSASTRTWDISAFRGQIVFAQFYAESNEGSSLLYTATFTVQDKFIFSHGGKDGILSNPQGFMRIDNVTTQTFFSTGVFTSEIYNTVSVSSFSTFDVNSDLNGGAIAYSIRVGTNAGAVSASTFTAILPGALIPGNTSTIFVQWKATFTAASGSNESPELFDATINWTQGEITNQTIYGFNWKKRYWISGSTGTSDGDNDIVLVQSRDKNAWVPYDLRIGPMTQFNGNFYVASATNSVIYRADYGTNDAGYPIGWLWQSRDESWEDFVRFKRLMEVQVEFRKDSAANTYVGYSSDSGESWSEKLVSMSGSGRGSDRLFVNGGRAAYHRLRIRNGSLDERATILGITPWAIKEQRRQ